MSILVHMSDPHFGTEDAEVLAALRRLIDGIRPQCIMLSGDITQRARRSQFEAARAFCIGMPCPVIAIPGNHDIPLFNLLARVCWPYAGYQRVFGENLEPVWESETWRIVGINSTSPRRHKDGELDEATIQRACARLRAGDPTRLQIVALHHPLHAITEADRVNLAHGHHAALHAFADAGADLILSGHIHLAYVRPLRAQIPTLSRELWAVQAGTAISTRVRGTQPNSIHLIRAQPGEDQAGSPIRGCSVEQWDHSASEQQFVHVRTTQIARQA